MRLVVTVVQPITELFIAALGTGMLLILESLSLTQRATVYSMLLASRGLHYYVKVFYSFVM